MRNVTARQTARRLKTKSSSVEFNNAAMQQRVTCANLPTYLSTYPPIYLPTYSRSTPIFHLQTVCTLFLYNATRENVIAVARLGTDNPPLNSSQAQSLQHLLRVKVSESRMDLFAARIGQIESLTTRALYKPRNALLAVPRKRRRRRLRELTFYYSAYYFCLRSERI